MLVIEPTKNTGDTIKGKIGLLLFIVALIVMLPSANATSIGAYNVKITSKYVVATGKGSCSLDSDYQYHTRAFYNYNPSTGHHGVLNYEVGDYSGSDYTSPEGLWFASDNDMDFCLVHGKSHDSRGYFLIPYNGVINGWIVKNGYFIEKQPQVNNSTNMQNISQNNVSKQPEPTVNINIHGKNVMLHKHIIEDMSNRLELLF
jgi:hypothetical protein